MEINKNKDHYNSNKYEYDHFKIHSFNKAVIDILCIEPDQDRRLELESKYIVNLKTAYPYGLNDRVNNISVTSVKDKLCIYKSFFKVNSTSIPKTNRIRSKNRINRFIDFKDFLDEVCKNCFNYHDFVKFVKGKILGLSRRKAKLFIPFVKNFKFNNSHVKDLIIDLIKFKSNSTTVDVDHSQFDSYLVIDFSHKYIDSLDIPSIIHNQELIKAFPRNETYPKVSFKYSPTLGSMVFNYSNFSKNINSEDIEDYP